jgi:uncharacterized membrane protein YhiD involved in acid resistance
MPSAFSPEHLNLTLGQVGLNLMLAFGLAFMATTVYRRLYSGPAAPATFQVTLMVTPLVVCMIMMAIGTNIALSLGLVGALSIIRFRTVIKDTRDMAFLFLMIGIGLCCGSGSYALAIVGTAFVLVVLLALQVGSRQQWMPSEFILVFRQGEMDHGQAERTLDSLVSWRRLQGVTDLGEQGCEYTYHVRLGRAAKPEQLVQQLRATEGVTDSVLLSPESQLAL